jgi:GTP-binding protein HflX
MTSEYVHEEPDDLSDLPLVVDDTSRDGPDDDGSDLDPAADPETGAMDLEDRQSLRRVASLSTELEDVSEVEYRQLRLERVVLVGVWTQGSTTEDAENSLADSSCWPRRPAR